ARARGVRLRVLPGLLRDLLRRLRILVPLRALLLRVAVQPFDWAVLRPPILPAEFLRSVLCRLQPVLRPVLLRPVLLPAVLLSAVLLPALLPVLWVWVPLRRVLLQPLPLQQPVLLRQQLLRRVEPALHAIPVPPERRQRRAVP